VYPHVRAEESRLLLIYPVQFLNKVENVDEVKIVSCGKRSVTSDLCYVYLPLYDFPPENKVREFHLNVEFE
jgi:hypothetical protein